MSDVMVQFRHKGLVRNKKYLGSIFIFESINHPINGRLPPQNCEIKFVESGIKNVSTKLNKLFCQGICLILRLAIVISKP
jgi:hypothetical protein